MKKNTTLFIFMMLVVVLLPACQQPPQELPVIRIGHAPHDHHSPLYIAAMNRDYFKAAGGPYVEEVVFKQEYILYDHDQQLARLYLDSSTGGKEIVRKLSERFFDMSFGGVPAILDFIDQGRELRILAPANSDGAGLVVKQDLALHNWPEFVAYLKARQEPLRIGYKIAVSVQNLIFEAALKASEISYSMVKGGNEQVLLVNLFGAKNLIPALEAGVIDGFVVMQPFVAMAERQGVGTTVAMLSELPPVGQWQGIPCCAFAARADFIAEHPVAAEAITALMLSANKRITEYPDESARQIAKWLGVDPEVERLSLPTISFVDDFDAAWQGGVNFWVQNMIDSGQLNGSVKSAFESGGLKEFIYDMPLFARAQKRVQ